MPESDKSRIRTSEFWLTLVTTLLGVAMAVLKNDVAIAWASGIAAILSTSIYAFFQTPLRSAKPGMRTKVFWASALSILGSVAVTITELSIPGMPDGITQGAGMLVAALTAGGYTIYRYQNKIASTSENSK